MNTKLKILVARVIVIAGEVLTIAALLAALVMLLVQCSLKPARAQTRPVFVDVCGQLPDFQGNPPADVAIICPRVYLAYVSN